MSLWASLLQTRSEAMEQIRMFYGNNFPIEVRHYLADWIEEKLLNAPVYLEHDPQFELDAANFLNQLINELEKKSNEMTTDQLITSKMRLNESARNFRQSFSHNPGQLYSHLRNCLLQEKQLLNYPDECTMVPDSEITEIIQNIQNLHILVRSNESENRNLHKEYENFCLQLHEFSKNTAQLESMEVTTVEMRERKEQILRGQQEQVDRAINELTGKRLNLVDNFREVIRRTQAVQSIVLGKYVTQWKVNQGYAGNGAPLLNTNNLDVIQGWCESLADIIWNTREQIRLVTKYKKQVNADEQNLPDYLPTLHTEITNLLMNLITSTFVIEKQPPQVMKTNTRFASTVRLLIGNTLNIKMNNPLVKVSIVSETQAQITQQTSKYSEVSCGEIINNTGNMEYNETTKQLSVSFRNMQLKKIKRAEKKGTESVMDEKFALLFQSNFAVGHGDIVFTVWVLSLPVVVIVHGNQEPQSWATITWDNAFSEVNRVPFSVPDKVPWNRLAEALNMKFRSSTGRSLTPENLHFLCEKAFKANLPFPVPNDILISWSQFCKEPLPERTFTFWEWYYAAMKLTREHLRGPWNDGSIIGFVHKRQAEEMLLKCPRGTFILRFSDSELGGITIAWVNEGNEQQPHVLHIQPFTSKDFGTRSLSDRIRDFDDLTILFPNKSKSDAFDRYTTPLGQPKNKDYIQSEIRAILPTSGNTMSYPNTPQSYNIQSPDPSRDTPSVASGYGLQEENVNMGSEIEYSELANLGLDNLEMFASSYN